MPSRILLMWFSISAFLVLSALSSQGLQGPGATGPGASIGPSSLEATSSHDYPTRFPTEPPHQRATAVHSQDCDAPRLRMRGGFGRRSLQGSSDQQPAQHYQQCLHEIRPGSKVPDAKARLVFRCRYGARTSQRLVALMHRTWAPQSNPALTEIPRSKATKPPPDLSVLVPRLKIPASCKASSGAISRAESDDVLSLREPLEPLVSGPGRVVVFAALSGGPVCSGESREDWREELPRRLGELLGVRVVVYSHRHNTCHYCYLGSSSNNRSSAAAGAADPSGCVRDIKGAGVGALVVLGSGEVFPRGAACFPAPGEKHHRQDGPCQQQFFDLWQLLSKPWARSARHLVRPPPPPLPPYASPLGPLKAA